MAEHPRLNCASTALEQLPRCIQMFEDGGDKGTAAFCKLLADGLRDGSKFLLPDGGSLFGPDEDRGRSAIPVELFRLPFPCTVVEYMRSGEWNTAHQRGAVVTPRRLAVAFDLAHDQYADLAALVRDAAQIDEASGALVFPINDMSAARPEQRYVSRGVPLEWVPNWCGVYVAYGQTLQRSYPGDPGMADLLRTENPGRRVFSEIQSKLLPLGEFGARVMDGYEQEGLLERNAAIDAINEVWAVIEMGVALACRNVSYDTILAPRAINEKRRLKGRPPLFEYHILTVDVPGEVSRSVSTPSEIHRSPRPHLRRGHIRRLSDGRAVWVNAAMVNAAAAGFVSKDYKVRPSP